MKIRPNNRAALGMIALLIFVAAVLIIAGSIVYMLCRLCQQIFPPSAPPQTNSYVMVMEMVVSNKDTVLPPITAAPVLPWNAELQRSTNLVDWEPILQCPAGHVFDWCDDTNPPQPAAFYRMRYWQP